jgi:hypothetical protein
MTWDTERSNNEPLLNPVRKIKERREGPPLDYTFLVLKEYKEGKEEDADYKILADHNKMIEVFYEQQADGTVDPRFFWGVKEIEDEKGEFWLSVVPIDIDIGPVVTKCCNGMVNKHRTIRFKEWSLDKEFMDHLFKSKALAKRHEKIKSKLIFEDEKLLSKVAFVDSLRETWFYKNFDTEFVVKEVSRCMEVVKSTSSAKCVRELQRRLNRVQDRKEKLNEAKMDALLRFRCFNSTEISRIEYELKRVTLHQEWRLQWTRVEEEEKVVGKDPERGVVSLLREVAQIV